MSVLAAVDVGTNTIRMLVARTAGPRLRPLLRMRRITGLGKALRDTGAIGKREFRASLRALREFRHEMDRLGVAAFRACGTAALREASNAEEFLAAARRAGIPVETISAGEEARLTWRGVRGETGRRDGTVVVDIGGGSTELIRGPREKDSVSLPIGVVVLLALFPISDPPRPWETANLKHYLAERIGAGTAEWGRPRVRRLVGTAGTFTTLAALDLRMRRYRPERIDGYRMGRARLAGWERRLTGLTAAERLALPGMEKGRERYIVPGVLMAAAALERFGANALEISDAGLLEGILAGLARTEGEKGA